MCKTVEGIPVYLDNQYFNEQFNKCNSKCILIPYEKREEIDAFVDCVESGEKLVSHIDTNIITKEETLMEVFSMKNGKSIFLTFST